MGDDTVELVYFETRGRAEIARFISTVANIPYREVDLLKREDYLAVLPELPFGQVPLLRIDGLNLVQSETIARYLATKGNLVGDSQVEAIRIDMLYEGTRDFNGGFLGMLFTPEDVVIKQLTERILPKYLPAFNKLLTGSSSGYLVGSRLSLADVGLMEALLATVDYFGEETLTPFTQLESFYKRLLADERIMKYVNQVRKPKNTQSRVDNINATLSE